MWRVCYDSSCSYQQILYLSPNRNGSINEFVYSCLLINVEFFRRILQNITNMTLPITTSPLICYPYFWSASGGSRGIPRPALRFHPSSLFRVFPSGRPPGGARWPYLMPLSLPHAGIAPQLSSSLLTTELLALSLRCSPALLWKRLTTAACVHDLRRSSLRRSYCWIRTNTPDDLRLPVTVTRSRDTLFLEAGTLPPPAESNVFSICEKQII